MLGQRPSASGTSKHTFMAANSIHGAAVCLKKRGCIYIEQKEFLLAEEYVRRRR